MGSFVSKAVGAVQSFTGMGDPTGGAGGNLGSIGGEDTQLGRDQFAWAKDMGDTQFGLTQSVVGRQNRTADFNNDVAVQQWGRYKDVFMPAEDKMVSDAMNYDSTEQMDRVRQEAAGNANSAFDTAQTSRNIGLTQMGVNPNSGRFTDSTAMNNARTMGVADSMNRATAGRADTAIGLRAGVANYGRNMPNTAAQFSGLSYQGGNSAVGNMNSTVQSMAGVQGTPAQWANYGLQGYQAGGALNVGGYNANTGRLNALNNIAKTGLTAAAVGGFG